MAKIEEILDTKATAVEKIALLKNSKNVIVPNWGELLNEFEPTRHEIMDKMKYKDKKKGKEPISRICIGFQKLSVKRMTEFMFAIPVKRVYHGAEIDEAHRNAANALEKIYKTAKYDSQNLSRARDLFSTCEVATLFYTRDKDHKSYGFETSKKICMKTYSPKKGYKLYPYFDEYGDLIAMSVEYTKIESSTTTKTYFDTYTATRHIIWNVTDGGVIVKDEVNPLGKIPYVYSCREAPIWEDTSNMVKELELTLSKNSDVIAYNSAPVLVVEGKLDGEPESKGTPSRLYKVEKGGRVSYVSWEQATESVKQQVDIMQKLYWQMLQLPDLSLDNIKSSLVSGEARKTLLTDAHLKVGDEKGDYIEIFEREGNLLKEMLKKLNPKMSAALDDIEIEYVVTPFIQNDETVEIANLCKLAGGVPLISQKEAIGQLAWSENPEETIAAINNETKERTKSNTIVGDIFQ